MRMGPHLRIDVLRTIVQREANIKEQQHTRIILRHVAH